MHYFFYFSEATVAAEKAAERDEQKRRDNLEALENLAQGKGYKNKVKVEHAEFSDGIKRSNDSNKKSSSSSSFRPGMT